MGEVQAIYQNWRRCLCGAVDDLNKSPKPEGTSFYFEDRAEDDYQYVEIGQSIEGTLRPYCGVVCHDDHIAVLPLDPSKRIDMFVISPAVDGLRLRYPGGQERTVPRDDGEGRSGILRALVLPSLTKD